MKFCDTLTLDAPRRTSDGYLVASVRAARTGIQDYAGYEVGKPDRMVVRVYRPEAEVFSKDSLRTLAHRPVTVDHPPVAVTADNWRDYAVGMTGDEVARDGEFIRVPLSIMDADAISAVSSGKNQLSCGYTCDLDWTAGVTEDGKEYDAVQKNIRFNHISAVGLARGGPELKIGDKTMTTRTITVDGLKVEVADKDAAIIERQMAKDATAIAELTTQVAKLTADVQTKDAEIATIAKQLADATSPEALSAAVAELADVSAKANAILGDSAVIEGKTADDIRKQVVDAKLGDVAKGWTADQVSASFAALTATITPVDRIANAISNIKTTDATNKSQSLYVDRMTRRTA